MASDNLRRLEEELPPTIAELLELFQTLRTIQQYSGPSPDLAAMRGMAPTFRLVAKKLVRVADLFDLIPEEFS